MPDTASDESPDLLNEITPEDFGIETDRGASTLKRIGEIKALIKALTDERKMLEEQLKNEMGGDNSDPVVDGEHGLVAYLKPRRKPASIDLSSMAKHPDLEVHIVEAARSGALVATLGVVRPLRGKVAWADALLRYEMDGGETETLVIEELE